MRAEASWGPSTREASPSAYHDHASRLLCGAHAHDWCHADGGPLEIDPTRKQKEGLSLISCRVDTCSNVSKFVTHACKRLGHNEDSCTRACCTRTLLQMFAARGAPR